MKAAVLEGNRNLVIKEYQLNELDNDNVRVKVHSCGICGSDIPRVLNNGAHFYPLILGHEFYGEVTKVGKNVNVFKPGDKVVGIPLKPCFECEDCKAGNYSLCKNYKFIGSSLNGAYCEEFDISAKNVFKIHDSIANDYCALFEPSAVALHAIKFYDKLENKNVAVIGGGTIGTLIANWAKIYGAKNVALFEINLDNVATYHNLGIEHLYTSTDEGLEQAKKELLEGLNGFDYVFDAAGCKPTILYSLKAAGNRANVCLVGTPTKEMSFSQKEWEIINRKELTIKGSWMCYSAPFPGIEWEETNEMLLKGKLKFTKDYFAGFFNLEDAAKAFEFIENKKEGKVGRVCLLMK